MGKSATGSPRRATRSYQTPAVWKQIKPLALLINNRKGVHARSSFTARYDGEDRWLQRTYVRRSLWSIRYRVTPENRRVHY